MKRTALKRTPSKRKTPNAQARADVLFARIVRGAGRCFAAGERFECSGYMSCCHIISRRYHAIRWDDMNAVAMCSAHHVWYTHHPLEWRDFIEARLPGVWDELHDMALHGKPEKAADALKRLQAIS